MDDIYPILRLHCEAFADKFGAAFGVNGTARGIEAMAEAWRRQGRSALRGMFVADSNGLVVGTISLRTWDTAGDASSRRTCVSSGVGCVGRSSLDFCAVVA